MSVMAAPNRSEITARVEGVDRVQGLEGSVKWYFTVAVIAARALEGGLFVRAGETARVFAVADDPGLRPADVFRAEVEDVGGPGAGDLQLLRLDPVRPGADGNEPIIDD